MIQISEATKDHFPTIQSIAHRTWPATFGKILSRAQITYMLEMMYSLSSLTEHVEIKNHVFLLAKEGEEALGFASYELNCLQQSKTKIHKIYILPTSQGLGIGKLMINRILEIAKSNGNEKLSLNVNRNNKAVEVYKKWGFEIVKEEDIDIGNGFFMNDYVMEKSLL